MLTKWLQTGSSGTTPEPGEIRAAQMATFARQTPVNTLVTIATTSITAAILWPVAPRAWVAVWAILQVCSAILLLYKWWRQRDRAAKTSVSPRGPRKAILWALSAGGLWGFAATFLPAVPPAQQLAIVFVVGGMAGGAAITLAPLPSAAGAFIAASVFPVVLFLVLQADSVYFGLGMLASIYALALFVSARLAYRTFVETVRTRAHNAQLLRELETARQEWLEISDTANAFALFDEDDRLLLWNEAYPRLLSMPDECMRRGVSRRELLANCSRPADVEDGRVDPESWLERHCGLRDGPTLPLEDRLANGHWIRSTARRSDDGRTATFHVDITELKEREAALRASEAKFRNLIEGSLQGIFVVDPEWRPLFVNDAAARIFGYDGPEEMMALETIAPIFAPHEAERIQAFRDARLRGETQPATYTYEGRRKDGSPIWLDNMSRGVDWDGQRAIQVTVVDATERHNALEALRESEERFRTIADEVPMIVWVCDAENRPVFFNRASLEFVGLDLAEALEADLFSFYHPDDVERVKAWDAATANDPRPYDIEYRLRRADGRYCWMREHGVPRFAPDGSLVGYIGTLVDETDQREAWQALQESEQRFQDFAEASADWFWETDGDHRISYISSAVESATNTPVDWILGRTRKELAEAFEGQGDWHAYERALDLHQPFRDFVYSLKDLTGRTLWFSVSGTPRFADDGAFLGYRGATTDITERRKADELLREAIESISEGFILLDSQQRIVTCNSRYRDFYAGVAELLAPGAYMPDILRAAVERGQVPDAMGHEAEWMRKRLEQYATAEGVHEQRLLDGRCILASERKTPDGGTVGIRTNITDRKRAEEALRQSETRFRAVVENSPSGIYLKDLDGRFQLCNRRIESLYGVRAEDALGKTLFETERAELAEQLSEQDREVIACRGVIERDFEVPQRDGSLRSIICTKFPILDDDGTLTGIGGIDIDNTERERAEEALRLTQFALDRTSDSTFRLDREGRFVYVNETTCKMLGYARDALMQMRIADIDVAVESGDLERAWKRIRGSGRDTFETNFRRSDGSLLPVEITTYFLKYGKVELLNSFCRDITQRKKAEEAIRNSEAQMRLIADNLPAMITYIDRDRRYRFINRTAEKWYGREAAQIVGKTLDEAFSSAFVRTFEGQRCKVLAGETVSFEQEVLYSDGVNRSVAGTYVPDFDEAGIVRGYISLVMDISERKEAEEALRQSEERFRSIVEHSPASIVLKDIEGHYRLVNRRFAERYERVQSELIGKTDYDIHPAAIAKAYEQHDRLVLQSGTAAERDFEVPFGDGTKHAVTITKFPVLGNGGRPIGIGSISLDVTERKRAEEALREREEQFRVAFEQVAVGMAQVSLEGGFIKVNQTLCAMLGYREPELTQLTFRDVTHPDDMDERIDRRGRLLAGEAETYSVEKRYLAKDGSTIWCNLSVSLVRGPDGEPRHFISAVQDITERKRAEAALRESEERFRAVVENSPSAVALKDRECRFRLVNPRFEEWFGVRQEEVIGKTAQEVHVGSEGITFEEHDRRVLSSGQASQREHVVSFADGSSHTLAVTKFPVFGDRTEPIGIGSISLDVTEQRRAEDALRQAQKMEAVGQLTGGVAHDFNNLLTVILGNLELLEYQVGAEGAAEGFVRTALKAAERGADLTQRLLAFSRKQALRPEVIDVNDLVVSTIELLTRTLGENIELCVALGEDVKRAMVDPNQLGNALLNLAVNARDAMAEGGTIAIESANVRLERDYTDTQAEVTPGDYVMIAVSDTGAGMATEIARRAFDPFFTTKEVGEGSGLGLSMVYGFAKQSRGHVSIYSEVGEGTTVRLYLPLASADEIRAADEPSGKTDMPRGQEVVLLVEDDSDVRTFTATALVNLGYTVLEAAHGPEALEHLEQIARVDLLLTDVVLPRGMNGRKVAEVVATRFPDVKRLFMSGYTADAVVHHGRLDAGVDFIQKPFTREVLARRVRAVLDGDAGSTG